MDNISCIIVAMNNFTENLPRSLVLDSNLNKASFKTYHIQKKNKVQNIIQPLEPHLRSTVSPLKFKAMKAAKIPKILKLPPNPP